MLLSLLGVSEKIVFMIFLCAKNNKLETNSEIQEVPFKFLLINDLLGVSTDTLCKLLYILYEISKRIQLCIKGHIF